MADSARHNLLIIEESTRGITPAASPALLDLRHTSCSLKVAKGSNKSAELHQDGEIRDLRHGTKQVNGEVGVEFSYGSFDDILEAAFGGTWAPKATITAATLAAVAVDNTFADSGSGFVTAGFEVGDRVTVTGFTGDLANNLVAGVLTAVAAGTLTIGGTDGDVIVDDAAGESVTIVTTKTVLKVGTARRFFTMIRHFSDLDSGDKPYHFFTGCEFTGFNISIPAEGMVTGAFPALGINQTLAEDLTDLTTPTIGEPTTTKPFDSFTGTLTEGGGALAIVTEISLTLAKSQAPRFVVGSATADLKPTVGQADVTGTLTAYFENSTLLEKFLNETDSSIAVTITDLAGNSYILTLPLVKYTDAPTDVSGEGSVTVALPFQALRDATEGTTLKLTKVPA